MILHEFISPSSLILVGLGIADAAGLLPTWMAVVLALIVLSGYARHIRWSRP